MARFDNTQAFAEGWGLFNFGEIQRLDEGRIPGGDPTGDFPFDSDEAALEYVRRKAGEGSEYHRAALALWNGREEYNYGPDYWAD